MEIEERVWRNMRTRANARGLPVHKAWSSYGKFLKDMGRRPAPTATFRRRDTNRGFMPDNCYWHVEEEEHSPWLNRYRIARRKVLFWTREAQDAAARLKRMKVPLPADEEGGEQE